MKVLANVLRARARHLVGAALVACSASALAQQPTGAPIVVGAIMSLTGPLAPVGLPERDGVRLAVKKINEAGGIKGRPLQILFEDDASSPDAAVSKANSLIFDKKVKALIGATGLAATVATGALTAQQKVLQLANSGMGPAVEQDRKCVFHITPAQELNARSLLSYAKKAIGAKRAGLLHDAGFGQSVATSVQKLAGEYGMEIVATEKFEIGANDTIAQASKIKAAKPDVVLIVTTTATPFRNARQVRMGAPIVTVHAAAPYDIVKAMGDGAEGVVFADFLVAEQALPHQKEFVEAFQKEYGRLPKNFDAGGYDRVLILAKALEKAGPDAPSEKICEAAKGPFQGVMAAYDFSAPDMGGLRVSSFSYSTFANGKFTRVPFTP